MGFTCRPNTAAADWLLDSDTPPLQLITFGPMGFDCYARLRFIPDPTGPGQEEADAVTSADRMSDIEQTRRALHRLAAFTATPDECYFGVWDGYSDIEVPTSAPRIELPHRRYALLAGSVSDMDDWEGLGTGGLCAPPAFVWPADRSWCFASDVDPHWAGIGATPAAVGALLKETGLDVVIAEPGEPQPAYR